MFGTIGAADVQLSEPADFGSNIANVAQVLKDFLKQLPEPILPPESYFGEKHCWPTHT